ncbi:MAG: YidC/Oxa1 family membrane protein insertase [Anaerovibrio sp.]|nr:YidC/Oxa1 family membrane protein insertase [Anaerovibrio sp.]
MIQMIIFIILLYSVYTYKYGYSSELLWLTNLYESDPTFVMPMLLVLLCHIPSKVGTEVNTQANKKIKYIKYIILLAVGCIAINLPAGVVFYWCINIMLSIIYELLFSRRDEGENL